MDIRLYNGNSSAFQAKTRRWIESFHCEGLFGLKSRIFITAEFILRGESAALTLPERQN